MSRNRVLRTRASWAAAVLASAAAAAVVTPGAGAPATPIVAQSQVPFVWRHEHARFSYVGFTVRYTCDGLESQVRRILVYLGARKDAKVNAVGCPFGSTAPSRSAWVDAEFDVPAPAPPGDAGAAGEVARWRDVKLSPRQPDFLTDGDCELIQGMKEIFTKTLPLRALEYRTSCFPGSLSPDGFEVRGQALEIIEPRDSGAR